MKSLKKKKNKKLKKKKKKFYSCIVGTHMFVRSCNAANVFGTAV